MANTGLISVCKATGQTHRHFKQLSTAHTCAMQPAPTLQMQAHTQAAAPAASSSPSTKEAAAASSAAAEKLTAAAHLTTIWPHVTMRATGADTEASSRTMFCLAPTLCCWQQLHALQPAQQTHPQPYARMQ